MMDSAGRLDGPPISGTHKGTAKCSNSGKMSPNWLPQKVRCGSPTTTASNPRAGLRGSTSRAAACGLRYGGIDRDLSTSKNFATISPP